MLFNNNVHFQDTDGTSSTENELVVDASSSNKLALIELICDDISLRASDPQLYNFEMITDMDCCHFDHRFIRCFYHLPRCKIYSVITDSQ